MPNPAHDPPNPIPQPPEQQPSPPDPPPTPEPKQEPEPQPTPPKKPDSDPEPEPKPEPTPEPLPTEPASEPPQDSQPPEPEPEPEPEQETETPPTPPPTEPQGVPIEKDERKRLDALALQAQSKLHAARIKQGTIAGAFGLLGLISWFIGLFYNRVSFASGFFSGLAMMAAGAWFGRSIWLQIQRIQRLQRDQADLRKRVIEGFVNRKEETPHADGMHYTLIVSSHRFPVSWDDYKRVTFNDPVKIHIGWHSAEVLTVEPLKSKKKKIDKSPPPKNPKADPQSPPKPSPTKPSSDKTPKKPKKP